MGKGGVPRSIALLASAIAMAAVVAGCGSSPKQTGSQHVRDTSTLQAALLGHWKSPTWDAYFSPTTETMVLSKGTVTSTYKVISEDPGKRAITIKAEGADFQDQPPAVIVFNKDFTSWTTFGSDATPTYVDASQSPN